MGNPPSLGERWGERWGDRRRKRFRGQVGVCPCLLLCIAQPYFSTGLSSLYKASAVFVVCFLLPVYLGMWLHSETPLIDHTLGIRPVDLSLLALSLHAISHSQVSPGSAFIHKEGPCL